MLRSTLLKTVRDQRWAALGWGGGLAVLVLLTAAGWGRVYPDQAARAAIARAVEGGLSFASVVYGEPRHLDQVPGVIEWRGLGLAPVLLGLFLVLAATGTTRGAEERGELDVLMTMPHARARLFAEQAGGLLLALLVSVVLVWVSLPLSGRLAKGDPLHPGRAALAMLNVGAAAALFGAIGLLAAQLARTRRAAALAAGLLLVLAHIWNNLSLVVPTVAGARRLSPLYLYSRSSPLADGHVDVVALGLLVLLAGGTGTLAGLAFTRRDLHAASLPVPRLPAGIRRRRVHPDSVVTQPAGSDGSWLLRSSLGAGLREVLGTALVWGVALGALAAAFAAMTPNAVRAIREQANAEDLLRRLGQDTTLTDATFLSYLVTILLPPLVGLMAVTLAASWAGEAIGGRLELPIAATRSRRRYFLERVGAAAFTRKDIAR
jgi:ABC-2 type transport system permease protein